MLSLDLKLSVTESESMCGKKTMQKRGHHVGSQVLCIWLVLMCASVFQVFGRPLPPEIFYILLENRYGIRDELQKNGKTLIIYVFFC